MNETKHTQQMLEQTADSKYHSIEFKKRGGTRDIFFAPWGPSHETRVLKVDRVEEGIESPRALRHVQRGYNTQHERRIAGILQQRGGHPSLNKLVDYWELPDGRSVNVYEHFAGTTLEEVVAKRPLTREEFIAVFRDVLGASKFMISGRGIVHRDKKPSNILVDRDAIYDGRRTVAQITDFTNAEEIVEIEKKQAQALPTVGGHFVTDPRLMERFTGAARLYNIQDEIYQDCQDMLFAGHGIHPYEFDVDRCIGINHLNGESLLTIDGRLDERKAENALEMALDRLPIQHRSFRKAIKGGLTGNISKRYKSVDDLATEFEKGSQPGLFSKIRRNWRSITAAAALGAGAILGAVVPFYNSMEEQRMLERIESDKYEVVAAVDGIGLQVGNNLFDMELLAFRAPKPGESSPYVPKESAYVLVEPGDRVYTHVNLVSKPIPKKLDHQWGVPTLAGRIYIEGSEGKTMNVSPRSFNGAINWDMGTAMAHSYDNSKTIEIPNNVKLGNYRLVAEFYAPEGENEYLEKANLRFKQPGKIIARKAVPITVGKATLPFGLRSLTLGFPDRVSFGPHEQYARSNEPGLKAVSEVIGGGRMEREEDYSVNVDLPPVKEGSKRIVKMYLEHNGQEIFRTVSIVQSLSDKSPLWEHYVPDKNFYKTLQNIMPFPSEQ